MVIIAGLGLLVRSLETMKLLIGWYRSSRFISAQTHAFPSD